MAERMTDKIMLLQYNITTDFLTGGKMSFPLNLMFSFMFSRFERKIGS